MLIWIDTTNLLPGDRKIVTKSVLNELLYLHFFSCCNFSLLLGCECSCSVFLLFNSDVSRIIVN